MKVNLDECLASCGLSYEYYGNFIKALSQISWKDLPHEATKPIGGNRYPPVNAMIRSVFRDCAMVAEDRGPVYALWISRIGNDGTLQKLLFFDEFAWGSRPCS